MHVRVRWHGKPRMLTLHVHADGEWVEFARRNFGPAGLEETSVDALVRAVRNEVAETSPIRRPAVVLKTLFYSGAIFPSPAWRAG
jgi:hypothetical protein